MRRNPVFNLLALSLIITLVVTTLPLPINIQAGGCADALLPRLVNGAGAQVAFTDGNPLRVRAEPGLSSEIVAELEEGTLLEVADGPICADEIYWWQLAAPVEGWVAEGVDGVYFVTPLAVSSENSVFGTSAFQFDWDAFQELIRRENLPNPLTIQPPAVYAGDMPNLPVDLSTVRFVADAHLNEAQMALLAQNGFVVIPRGHVQFDDAYNPYFEGNDAWPTIPENFDYNADEDVLTDYGRGFFVTTDAMLHALHLIFDNLLTDLEKEAFSYVVPDELLRPTLEAAHAQAEQAAGTPLEVPARTAELYLAVGMELFQAGGAAAIVSPEVAAEAQSIAAMALAGEGQLDLPFLTRYTEDFSQYRPRGHYAGDPVLENYFRGMMWLSRITFRAKDENETLMALMMLRALLNSSTATAGWQKMNDVLTFLIGPVDDLGPPEYNQLATEIFGPGLPLDALADSTRLAEFTARLAELPGPRINGLVLPDDTTAEQVVDETLGFRFLGQRFTLDSFALQQMIYPYVGTPERPRLLPISLDVASIWGSNDAATLAEAAGETEYQNYQEQRASMQSFLQGRTPEQWLENVNSAWLWTLDALWRPGEAASFPPLMRTQAWRLKDLQSGLASWTELKHDTVLYAKQPTGFGGGGDPLTSYGYVEPNPVAFARIALVAAMTYQGLLVYYDLTDPNFPFGNRGMVQPPFTKLDGTSSPDLPGQAVVTTSNELRRLAERSLEMALIAQKELNGEPLTEDEYYDILTFGPYLSILLQTLYQGEGEPDPVALVTDVASNPSVGTVLQEGVGNVDYIFVVIPGPLDDLQLVRGGVFSYYEFIGDINQRMTDDEWRALVESGDLPPRPTWVSEFYSE